jgi:hypothetical protein
MILFRAAFWLTVMFLLIAPKSFDLSGRARDAGAVALDQGTQLVATELASRALSGALTARPAADAASASDAEGQSAPLPRPRLNRH